MFNQYTALSKNSVNFNAPATGIIQKSHPKSWMRNMQVGSELAKTVFSVDPYIEILNECRVPKKHRVVVLQTLLMSDKWMMVELVYKQEFEQIVKPSNDEKSE